MTLPEWFWGFAVATFLHNLEEAVWLPAWVQRHGALRRFPSAFAFRFAVGVLSVAFILVATLGAGRSVAVGLALAMGGNAFVPHLALTLKTRSYMPGTATAFFLIVPAAAGVIVAARPDGPVFWGVAVAVAFGLLASLPLLFGLGTALERRLT